MTTTQPELKPHKLASAKAVAKVQDHGSSVQQKLTSDNVTSTAGLGHTASTTDVVASNTKSQSSPNLETGKEPDQTGDGAQHVHAMAHPDSNAAARSRIPSLHAPSIDETGTTVSSADGFGQPISNDGKSMISTTTFALDEKESLRPDDSASVQAAEYDDLPSTQDQAVSATSENQPFREQLDEIEANEPNGNSFAGVPSDAHLVGGAPFVPISDSMPLQQTAYGQSSAAPERQLDPKLIEALENPRDRIWVLKLEQDVIDFVKDTKETSLHLPQCNSFYRMLAHKIADYYTLGHAVDESNSAVRLFKLATSIVPRPLTGVTTPSTAASTPPPSSVHMKILRRGVNNSGPAIANGSSLTSKTTSENGESGADDEKKPITLQEREARYKIARLRIMGSEDPADVADQKEKNTSRSSSAAGRRSRKKRADSDDDFEARSAFNSYVAPPTSGGQYQPQMAYSQMPNHQYAPFPGYGGPMYQQPPPNMQYWYQPMPDSAANWSQPTSPTYDLAQSFDRQLSFQQSSASSPTGNAHFAYPQPYAMPSPWNGGSYMPQQGNQMMYNDRPSSSTSHSSQPYAYGQLPSQALGRPPNALEHPLPGSYKSRHFNPQSQSFVPNMNGSARPPPQRTMSGPSAAAQSPAHYQSLPATPIQSRLHQPSLTHPLPQPVFPSVVPQSTPNAPLPPKPNSVPALQDRQTIQFHPAHENKTIAKWGTPASLPAKPPRRAEELDQGTKYPMTHSLPASMPVFGSMPVETRARDG